MLLVIDADIHGKNSHIQKRRIQIHIEHDYIVHRNSNVQINGPFGPAGAQGLRMGMIHFDIAENLGIGQSDFLPDHVKGNCMSRWQLEFCVFVR